MRVLALTKRAILEIIRDPLTVVFGLGFPIVLIIIMSIIQGNIPVEIFTANRLVPGMVIFGQSFLTLFSALLVAKDRETAFLERLFTAPIKAYEFILSYLISLLPLALGQALLCYLVGLCFKLVPTIGILYGVLGAIPLSIFFISLGLLLGSLLKVKQVGGISGALITNLTAFLSGIWFDLSLVGKGFETFCRALPFKPAVDIEIMLYNIDFRDSLVPILVMGAYIIVALALSIFAFLRQMKK